MMATPEAQVKSRNITYLEAIRETIADNEKRQRCFLIGEDVAEYGGHSGVSWNA